MTHFQTLVVPIIASILIGHWIKLYFDRENRMSPRPDPSSFSDSSQIRTTTLNIVLTADLKSAVLSGHVDIAFKRVNKECKSLVLDCKDLDISRILDQASGEELEYVVGDKFKEFGSPLTISLKPSTNGVTVHYKTSPTASGVQVLSPDQTFGEHPYLFTQNQAIHARSIVPCQDTPGIKTPYTAELTVDKPLVAVMSAVSVRSEESESTTTYFFNQKIPIPAYLLAIVIGDIVSQDISPRVRVWSEKANIDKCYSEFEDTETILKAAEEVAGEYVWGRYDLLVLPPSFPYGGMENPCLTFVTPTLLAGDKSLVNVVAHEIAHSWTGNLVTNANWEHFWLNEGFTVFLERKILAKLAGPEEGEAVREGAHMMGLNSLKYAIEVFGKDNPLTALNVNLDGVDPDDAFSSVPYEKGSTFLFYLETLVGGPAVFDPFLRSYIAEHAYKSITSEVFVGYFKSHFPNVEVDWRGWLTTPGMPLVIPKYDDSRQQKSIEVAKAWSNGDISEKERESLSSKQVISTLTLLHTYDDVTLDTVKQLDSTFHFGDSQNAEILFAWCRVCIKARYSPIVSKALNFVTTQGRMKFVRPIFRDLFSWKEYSQHAIDVFERKKSFYHNICRSMVEKDIQAHQANA